VKGAHRTRPGSRASDYGSSKSSHAWAAIQFDGILLERFWEDGRADWIADRPLAWASAADSGYLSALQSLPAQAIAGAL
jgi:hypothetical protein